MKTLTILVSFLFLACQNSTSQKQNANNHSKVPSQESIRFVFKTNTLTKDILNGANIYYYYPRSVQKSDTLTILLIFDPAAKGEEQIKKWQSIANERSILLISVSDSRNGLNSTDVYNSVSNLREGLKTNLQKPFYLYATGLSGGSRMAAALHLNDSFFNGLILCCAAPNSSDLKCPAILYSATEDMNFLECYKYFQSNPNQNLQMRIESGKHDWPTSLAMDAMLKSLLHSKISHSLVNTPKMNLSTTTLNYEAEQQILVNASYFKQPTDYWQALLAKKRASNEMVEKRILNYTSLYTYSVVNNPDVFNNLSASDYALNIYEWSDPDNSEWMYLRSVYYLQQKDEDNAFRYLEKAIKSNFSNTERLFANTYWKNYSNDSRFIKLIAQISN